MSTPTTIPELEAELKRLEDELAETDHVIRHHFSYHDLEHALLNMRTQVAELHTKVMETHRAGFFADALSPLIDHLTEVRQHLIVSQGLLSTIEPPDEGSSLRLIQLDRAAQVLRTRIGLTYGRLQKAKAEARRAARVGA